MATQQKSAEVIPLHKPNDTTLASEKKWGKQVCALGFSVIPSLIFKAQARLGLSATQLAVLLQIADHWWSAGDLPFPSKSLIAERLGLSPRQIQRHLTDLEKGGFIKRIERKVKHKGQLSNLYDLTGLVSKLKKLEPEFTKVAQQNKQITQKGGIPKNVVSE